MFIAIIAIDHLHVWYVKSIANIIIVVVVVIIIIIIIIIVIIIFILPIRGILNSMEMFSSGSPSAVIVGAFMFVTGVVFGIAAAIILFLLFKVWWWRRWWWWWMDWLIEWMGELTIEWYYF